jgi:PIN domain nuclease of toxin-antitoxin system
LPLIHNDPFDRMLIAQAKTEPLLLLTNNAALAGYGDCIELIAPRPRR